MNKTELIRRLSLPRFLLRKARIVLHHSDPYSDGLVTSLFQDSVEAFLYILGEHGGVSLASREFFDTLIDKVSKKFMPVSEHKAAATRLNKARVNFKHYGQNVIHEEAIAFAANAEALLNDVCRECLDLDFKSVSLVSAVGHRRTENWLHKAENFAGNGSYQKSLECAAKAFVIYSTAMLGGQFPSRESTMRQPNFSGVDRQLGRTLTDFTSWVIGNLGQVHTNVSFITLGVNPLLYRRFDALTPNVYYTITKTVDCSWGPGSSSSPSKEDAEFCINFVVEAAFQIRDSHLPDSPDLHSGKAPQNVIVERECDVIVYPGENPPEVIRKALAGEKLEVVSSVYENSEYVAVLQDGEPAYLSRNCVRRGE